MNQLQKPFEITLAINDRKFSTIIERSEEAIYRAAAKQLQLKILQYQEKYAPVANDKVFLTSLVALDYALELEKLKNEQTNNMAKISIEKMNDKILKCLSETV
ncbi:MAG: cell division protein ZapA [Bacteroidia bacterium]|nr:cell division protein ZapA [Bacteroidia bacterium]